jgi:hypothetical protein
MGQQWLLSLCLGVLRFKYLRALVLVFRDIIQSYQFNSLGKTQHRIWELSQLRQETRPNNDLLFAVGSDPESAVFKLIVFQERSDTMQFCEADLFVSILIHTLSLLQELLPVSFTLASPNGRQLVQLGIKVDLSEEEASQEKYGSYCHRLSRMANAQ